MKTYKSLIVALALFGLAGTASAGGRTGQGWNAYTVSIASAQVFWGEGFLNSIALSTPCAAGSYVVAFDTAAFNQFTGSPTLSAGYAIGSYVSSFTQVTPFLQYASTTGANGVLQSNGFWAAGQAADDYVQIRQGLFIYKSGPAFGGCEQATVYYSK